MVGTCRVVEREYTRTVDPSEVRPVPVLEEVGYVGGVWFGGWDPWVALVVGVGFGADRPANWLVDGHPERHVNQSIIPYVAKHNTGAPPRAGALDRTRGLPAGVRPFEVHPAGFAGAACGDAVHRQGVFVGCRELGYVYDWWGSSDGQLSSSAPAAAAAINQPNTTADKQTSTPPPPQHARGNPAQYRCTRPTPALHWRPGT